jgi:septum formation protein
MNAHSAFILASASPARLRTLRAAGLNPEVIVSGVDESTVESTSAVRLCATLARMKADAVTRWVRQHDRRSVPTMVLGCDSVLEFGGAALGKPVNDADAMARWRAMRGQSGVLHTGHCLMRIEDGTIAEAVASTTIHFANVTDAEIVAYVASGEPAQVAGAFTIDGLGGWFVAGIEGDPANVVGVSLPIVRELLADMGTAVTDLWATPLTSHA